MIEYMEETIQQPKKEETKSQVYYEQETKSNFLLSNTDGSTKQPEVIIAFYLLGVKPPWVMRMVYGD